LFEQAAKGELTYESLKRARVKVLIPMYEPLEVVKCKKCGKIIAEPKELVRIVNTYGDEE